MSSKSTVKVVGSLLRLMVWITDCLPFSVRKALKAAKFDSVRGPFRFNTNQYPIQNYYVRTVGSDGKGGLINKSFNEPILKNHGDAYVQSCAMKG